MLRPLATIGVLAAALFLAACEDDTQQQGARVQEDLMGRAISRVPVPQTQNFLTRESVAKWMRRQDTPDRPHYVYIFADTGQVIGYYVAQSRPVSTCTFMTPPVRPYRTNGSSGQYPLGPAPALDGVYYGGGGSCDQWFFFDAATDAMVEVSGFKIFTSDAPLAINAEPIRVEADGGQS